MFVGTGKPRKPEERARARELRRQGSSYKRIARELGVSPASAYNWTHDIELTPEQAAFNLGNGLSLTEIEDHWLGELSLPRSCPRKGVVDHFPTSSSGARRSKLPYGVCTLKVARSTWLVQHIFGAIQEYAGFEEPRWLG